MTNIVRLKKISVKDLLGLKRSDDGKEKLQEILKKQGDTALFRIAGNVTGYAQKATQYGENFALTGSFIAQNLQNGKVYESGRCYLPKQFSEDLVTNFANRSDASSGLEFKAEVYVMEDSSSATGYSYDVRPIETAENMAWRSRIMSELLALPAPAKTKKIA